MKNRWIPVLSAAIAAFTLSGCTPPMPPEFKADLAEKYVTCIDGTFLVSAPIEMNEVAQQWVDGYQESCPNSTPSLVDSDTPADVRLSLSGTALECPVAISTPIALDATVVAISNQDLAGLVLDPAVLYKMLTGQISSLGDPAIQEINPDLELSDAPFAVSPGVRQQDIDALSAWMNRLDPEGWPATPANLTAVPALDDAALQTAFEADGTLAIVPLSYALLNSFPTANIQTAEEIAVSDGDSVISASTQVMAEASGSVVNAALDPSVAAQPAPGTETILPPYQALTYYTLSGCGGATEMSQRAFIRYALRLDSQGIVTSSGFTALPEALRIDATTTVSQGLPEPTPQPTDAAVPSDEPITDAPTELPTDEATEGATPEPSAS
jgi:ABC-type phosphate transport system substrate-binding protein